MFWLHYMAAVAFAIILGRSIMVLRRNSRILGFPGRKILQQPIYFEALSVFDFDEKEFVIAVKALGMFKYSLGFDPRYRHCTAAQLSIWASRQGLAVTKFKEEIIAPLLEAKIIHRNSPLSKRPEMYWLHHNGERFLTEEIRRRSEEDRRSLENISKMQRRPRGRKSSLAE